MSLFDVDVLEAAEIDSFYKRLANVHNSGLVARLKSLAKADQSDDTPVSNQSILGFADFLTITSGHYMYDLWLTSAYGKLCVDLSNDDGKIIIWFDDRICARVEFFDKENRIKNLKNSKECETISEVIDTLVDNDLLEHEYIVPKKLFTNGILSDFLEDYKISIFAELDKSTDTDSKCFYNDKALLPIICFERELSINTIYHVTPDYRRFEPYNILRLNNNFAGNIIRYTIPFAGSEQTLLYRPNQSYVLPCSGEIENNKIQITYCVPSNNNNIEKVNDLFIEHWEYMSNMIGWINDEIKEFNVSIKERIDSIRLGGNNM